MRHPMPPAAPDAPNTLAASAATVGMPLARSTSTGVVPPDRQRRQWLRAAAGAGMTALTGAAGMVTGAAWRPARAAPGRPVLKAGDQKGGLHALLDAAGQLQNLAYDIEWTEFPAAAPLAEALNAQAVDCGPIGDAPAIFALAAGVRIKLIGAYRSDPYGTAVLVRPDSPLKGAADLKGRSIGTNRGSIGHFVALKALDSAGLKPDDANFRFLPPADAKLALVSGSLDAWATWEPYTAMAETDRSARVLVSGRGLWTGLGYLAATDAAIAARRDALRDFLQRVVRAQRWSAQHADAFSATLARIIGIAPDAARLEFTRAHQTYQPIDETVIADQQRSADFYLKTGLLKQRLDVRSTFDAGFPVSA